MWMRGVLSRVSLACHATAVDDEQNTFISDEKNQQVSEKFELASDAQTLVKSLVSRTGTFRHEWKRGRSDIGVGVEKNQPGHKQTKNAEWGLRISDHASGDFCGQGQTKVICVCGGVG